MVNQQTWNTVYKQSAGALPGVAGALRLAAKLLGLGRKASPKRRSVIEGNLYFKYIYQSSRPIALTDRFLIVILEAFLYIKMLLISSKSEMRMVQSNYYI